MKAWLVGGAAVAVGVGAMVLLPRKTTPRTPPPEPVAVVIAEPPASPPPVKRATPEPAPLPAVVDVTDISALLDPPALPPEPPATPGVIAVGFEDEPDAAPAVAPAPRPAAPAPIPPAAD